MAVAKNTHSRFAVPFWAVISTILLVTAATRFSAFGNPTYSADDPVFLLMGQSILDGQMPYVDVWDRKPIGLYLIFAAIRLLGGDGVMQSQIVAGAFVAATALTIERISRHFAGSLGSLLAALAYLIMLPMFRGSAAQVGLFYNLFMALAALLIVRSIARPSPPSLGTCVGAMLLCGVSMTLKQTTAIEGTLFGIALLIAGRRDGWSHWTLANRAGLMALTALFPIMLSFAAFAWLGHLGDYWFAAFESDRFRAAESSRRLLWRVGLLAFWALPFVAVAVAGAIARGRSSAINIFLAAWLLLALVGYAAIPRAHFYYFIPVALPLAISSATLFDRGGRGVALFAGLLAWSILQGAMLNRADTELAARQFHRLSGAVEANLGGGCLYIANGPPLLYLSTKACRVTPYVFPNHLMTRVEDGAIPADSSEEMRRILALRPSVIVFDTQPDGEFRNIASARLLRSALAGDYHNIGRFPQMVDDLPDEFEVWVRR